MKRRLKRFLAVIMVIAVAFTLMPQTLYREAKAAQYGLNIFDWDNNPNTDALSIKIGGQPFTSGMAVKNGDAVAVNIMWQLSNNANPVVEDTYVYDLAAVGMDFAALASGAVYDATLTQVGNYSITSAGLLTIQLTDVDYLAQSDRHGQISLNGTIDLSEISLNDEHKGVVTIASKDFGISVNPTDLPKEASVSKSAGALTMENGMPKRTFTVVVTALEATTGVTVTDTAGSDIMIKTSTISGITPLTTTAIPGKEGYCSGFTGTTGAMSKGDTTTITYDVYGAAAIYDSDADINWSNDTGKKNTVTVTDKNGNSNTSEVYFNVAKNWIDKSGTWNSDTSTASWTITVNQGDSIDIAGATVKDVPNGSFASDYDLTGVQVTVAGANLDTTISLADFISTGYTFPSDKAYMGKYTFSYTVPISTASAASSADVSTVNTATINADKYNTGDINSGNATVVIPGKNPLDSKEGKLSGTKISWTSKITIPAGGLSKVVYNDNYTDGLTLDEASVKVSKPAGGYLSADDYKFVKNGNSFSITFKDNPLAQGTYTITYDTECSPYISKTYRNTAYVTLDGARCAEKYDEVVYTKEAFITKEAYDTNADRNNAKTKWVVKIDASKLTEGETYSITDTLPANSTLVESSIIASASRAGSNPYTGTIGKTIADGKVTFNISSLISYAKANSWSDIYLIYQTEATLEAYLAYNWGYIYNKAELYNDDTKLDEVTASAQKSHSNIITKEGIYNQSTAPMAQYTIKINEPGMDLLDSGDSLTVTDTLPKFFTVVESTLKVYQGNTSTVLYPGNVSSGVSASYDPVTNKLEFTIPDELFVTIKYDAKVELKVGETLTSQNATNNVSITGVSNSVGATSDTLSGVVLQGSATAASETRTLTITKYKTGDTTTLLPNAKFSVKMVEYNAVSDSFVDVGYPDVVTGYSGPIEFTTNSKGTYAVTGLLYDHIYAVNELEAPDGYKKSNKTEYFVFLSQTAENAYPTGKNISFYPGSTGTKWIANDEAGAQFTISKKAVSGTDELAGASLSLYKDSVSPANLVKSWVSGSSTYAFTVEQTADWDNDEITAGNYILAETGAPDGYAYSSNISFTVAADGKLSSASGEIGANGLSLTMRDEAIGSVYISKKSLTGDDEIAGAHIVIEEAGSQPAVLVDEWDSTASIHQIDGSKFKAGTEYKLTETIAPHGYTVATEILFKVNNDGSIAFAAANSNTTAEVDAYGNAAKNNHIIVRDNPGDTFAISKKAVGGTAELPGATLSLYKDSVSNANLIKSWVSGTTSMNLTMVASTPDIAKNEIIPGDYVLVETGAPNGYMYAENIGFTVNIKGEITSTAAGAVSSDKKTLTMRDNAIGNKYVSKTSLTGREELVGAHMVITEAGNAGAIVEEWDSTAAVHVIAGTKFKLETDYKLTETIAPFGYKVTTEILFTVDRDGNLVFSAANTNSDAKLITYTGTTGVNYLIVKDETADTIAISKKAVGGTDELPGAALSLYKDSVSTANLVKSWVSGTTTMNFTMNALNPDKLKNEIAAGDYILVETGAPNGYTYSENIEFSVDANGKITSANGEVSTGGNALTMRDNAVGDIYISKTSLTDTAELAGAHIVLKEVNSNKVIDEWDSAALAHKIAGSKFIAGAEYVLIETAAPKGYKLTTNIYFTVGSNGEVALSGNNTNTDAQIDAYNSSPINNRVIVRDKAEDAPNEPTTTETTTEVTTEVTTEITTAEASTVTTTVTTTEGTDSVNTGDNANIALAAALILMSSFGVILMTRKKRRS